VGGKRRAVAAGRLLMRAAAAARRPETPAERAHVVFTSLGLRHLVVVDEASHVRGLITRRDLDAAAGHGAWRRNKMAPAPAPPPPRGAPPVPYPSLTRMVVPAHASASAPADALMFLCSSTCAVEKLPPGYMGVWLRSRLPDQVPRSGYKHCWSGSVPEPGAHPRARARRPAHPAARVGHRPGAPGRAAAHAVGRPGAAAGRPGRADVRHVRCAACGPAWPC